jgi:hypothetical protein
MSGMPRRADIQDRGRRFVSQDGNNGGFVFTTNKASVTLSGNFLPGTPALVLKTIDADTGEVKKTTTPGWLQTVTFNSANGGTIKCTLPGVMRALGASTQNLVTVKFKNAKKWADLETVLLYNNKLTSVTLFDWPSTTNIQIHGNTLLTYIPTHNWASLNNFNAFNCNLATFNTYAWPNMTILNLAGNKYLPNLDTQEWPSLVTLNLHTCNSMNAIEGHAWPNLVTLDTAYARLTTITTCNTWTKMTTFNLFYANVNAVETHPEWTELRQFVMTSSANLTTLNTYNEWTKCRMVHVYHNTNLTTLTIHPSYNTINYVNIYNCKMSKETIDTLIIDTEACGTSNGTLVAGANPGSGTANRSATANTAIANLVSRGWAVSQ